MPCDKIVLSASGKMNKKSLLLRDDDLDLQKAIKICQSYEQANLSSAWDAARLEQGK